MTLNVVSIANTYNELVGDLVIKPGPGLMDPATDGLKQDLTVAVTSVTTPVRRTYSKGMLPGVFPVPLDLGTRRRTLAVRQLLHRADHGHPVHRRGADAGTR